MTPVDGLRKVCNKFGFAVVGIPEACEEPICFGSCFDRWAGAELPSGIFLLVTARANRRQWTRQHKLLFSDRPDTNSHTSGARYFQCVPVDVDGNAIPKYKKIEGAA